MLSAKKLGISGFFLLLVTLAGAQRLYSPNSVLANGNFYKIAVQAAGVYKIDLAFLRSLGINTNQLPAGAVRIYGNGGYMLGEANNAPRIDDLQENAVWVEDGGDNMLDGSDYILFYANGPQQWIKDSINQRFTHVKNLYSDKSYYFISIGENGKRIAVSEPISGANTSISQFSGRYFHELDTLNFLASGKEWYGEEFSNAPGKTAERSFVISVPNLVSGSPLVLRTQCVSRSIGGASRFDISVNNSASQALDIAATGAGAYDAFAQQAAAELVGIAGQGDLNLYYHYAPGSFNAQGWLNWFELFYRQQLSLNGLGQLLFRDWLSVGNSRGEFIISDAPPVTRVWDITDPLSPLQVSGNHSGTDFRFVNSCERLREYIAFTDAGFLIPEALGRVAVQNLHNTSPADHIIITHPPFLVQAQRLAQFHQRHNGYRTLVVTTEQVYQEFSSASPDPTAIRDFVKMYFDKYGHDSATAPRYLLLFGDASYDYKDRLVNNSNYVPAYENNITLDVLSTYTTDDYYGFLDDNEDINSGAVVNKLDIGIGRVPAKNPAEAKNFVDKVEAYFDAAAMGPWRNNLVFIADDEDQNLHLQDAETITATAATVAPVFDLQKIYLDAYQQETGPGGSIYPQASQAISNQVYNGTLIWNFTGHGGPRRLTEETILDQDVLNSWNNPFRLPLLITATCDFAPYDNPLLPSIGENILLRPKTGAIGLMATTRIVFSFSNRIMNNNYLQYALAPTADGQYRTLGDAVREAKNFTYQTSGDISNNRKFTLLGDPGLTIAFPGLKVKATKINGLPVSQTDTLSATEKISIEGEVIDIQGNLQTDFNGTLYPVVYDKPYTIATRGNDPTSPVTSFVIQDHILFKGKASVNAGKFHFSFKVPRDINYQLGKGKLGLYADDGRRDGNGFFADFLVGGSSQGMDEDKEGPEIKSFLNDEKFVNGGVTNETPVLLLKLSDSSGINTVGTGIGHDITATLDHDNNRFFVLNDFYEGELDSYQQGMLRFQLPAMDPGLHTLSIKAWDVMNNSSEVTLDFTVAKNEELTLSHVLNYPNPFTTHTQFWFEHNKPGQDLQVRLQIFTLTGRVIKMIQKTINTPGNRSSDLEWNGRDQYGDRIGRGVYLYKLSVTAPGKLKKEKIEKLVIF